MSRSVKLLVGVATAAPLALAVYFLFRVLVLMARVVQSGGNVAPESLFGMFGSLLGVQIAVAVLTVILLVFYIWHLVTRRHQVQGELHVPIWLLVFVVLPMFAMPVYWFCHVWPEPDARGTRA